MSNETPPEEPLREKVFTITHVDAHGKTFTGAFRWVRPTLRDHLRIAAEQHRLSEGLELDVEYRGLAAMLAHLKVVLREVPKGWSWDEVEDPALLAAIFDEVRRLEERWFRGGGDDAGAGGAAAGAPAPAGA